MARSYEEYTRRGGQIAAIVVDLPAVNAALAEKLVLPFPILSDPDGEQVIKPNGLWNTDGKIAKPALIVLAPDGREVYRYVGADFVDRPNDEDVLGALDALVLPALATPTEPIAHLEPQPSPRSFRLEDLGPYLRGVRSAAQELAGRLQQPTDREEATRTAGMAERYLRAVAATRGLHPR